MGRRHPRAPAIRDEHPDEALLRHFSRTREPADRARIVEQFLPMARGLAMRYRASSESMDDLYQVASLGLVKALDRYDPDRGASFEAYAAPTILGELKRHFRDRVLPIHIPRGMKERGLRIGSAVEALTAELDRSPTVGEVAAHVGISKEETLEGLDAIDATRTVSLDVPVGGEDDDSPAVIDAIGGSDPRLESIESSLAVRDAFHALDERERACVHLRFGADLTQEEIARRVGVSQVHVSRILRVALEKMRAAVEDPEVHATP